MSKHKNPLLPDARFGSQFRPCIDLHDGKVKQIVGGTLDGTQSLKTNFISQYRASWYAEKYREDQLTGGHVIMLGPGNEEAAREALSVWKGGLQVGGGIRLENAAQWLEHGANKVIVTSWLFDEAGSFLKQRLKDLAQEIGAENLVVDLSCKAISDSNASLSTTPKWKVAMNRWQTLTDLPVTHEVLEDLAQFCAEFLIHAVDVEGKCEGIDPQLVTYLSQWSGKPITYAGGARTLEDLILVDQLSHGKVDLTIGSALDVFGGSGVKYEDAVAFNQLPLSTIPN